MHIAKTITREHSKQKPKAKARKSYSYLNLRKLNNVSQHINLGKFAFSVSKHINQKSTIVMWSIHNSQWTKPICEAQKSMCPVTACKRPKKESNPAHDHNLIQTQQKNGQSLWLRATLTPIYHQSTTSSIFEGSHKSGLLLIIANISHTFIPRYQIVITHTS